MNLVVSDRKWLVGVRAIKIKISLHVQLGLTVFWSVFTLNCAIMTIPNYRTSALSTDGDTFSKKEKRGVFGIGVHGSHHHHGYAPHYDDWAHNHHSHHHPPPLLPAAIQTHPYNHHPHPPSTHPVNLGQHFHTTVTKKIGIPIPYPVPYRVSLLFWMKNEFNERSGCE